MRNRQKDLLVIIFLFIISFLLVGDLFLSRGQPATFDGPTHLANIAQFHKSIAGGGIRVTWTDGFANYGMPLGLIAQQTTSYLGAFINLVVKNVVFSFNLTFFIGTFLSAVFFYLFLRLYFSPESAFLGAFVFNFAPYRIINIYIRGALPEYFSSLFLPLILIGIYFIFHQKAKKGFLILSLAIAGLVLSHPMMFVVNAFIFIPYIIFNLIKDKYPIYSLVITGAAMLVGLGIAGYYMAPLSYELKYFYYGQGSNHFVPGQSMTVANFISPAWHYFYKGDIFTRGHFIKSGLIESLLIVIGLVIVVRGIIYKQKKKNLDILSVFVLSAVIIVFLMTPWLVFLYKKISLLGNTQHQWRMFSSFIFIPPFVAAYLCERINKKTLFLIIILIISIARFPQLYGKNYTYYPDRSYYFTLENLHGNILNTIWTGPARDYPVKNRKGEIIEGRGRIEKETAGSSWRVYEIDAESDVRMVDYTFYFPGWWVYVDKKEVPIQFQDPSFRGVITYNVNKGKHQVEVKFTDTKIRLVGYMITLMALAAQLGLYFFISKLSHNKT
jgi:hypothetical protein